jgi:hypothetical protein
MAPFLARFKAQREEDTDIENMRMSLLLSFSSESDLEA